MKKTSVFILSILSTIGSIAQTTISNGNFETWGNSTPGLSSEPTGWFSNQSGSTIAALGPQTCYKDNIIFHGGTASVRVESKTYLGSVVNGNVTTGVVNAPTITKSDGYIGTRKYTDSAGDVRRMAFTGRPDSLVGWYQYTHGGATEQGKIRAILHTGHYSDPEMPVAYHIYEGANKIGDATFLTPTSNVATWTRFSVPFTYSASGTPAYIMINVTSSANQATTISGSKLWLDDLQAVYNSTTITPAIATQNDVVIYSYEQNIHVNFLRNIGYAATFSVFDLSGKLIHSETLTSEGNHLIRLSDASAGIYLYRLDNIEFSKRGRIFIQ